ncbi:MAG: hypothetical protein ACFB4I_15880 [Cyanophyceae cyanobacterium]
MDLDQQLQVLIHEAPQHGVPSSVMQKAVAPVLKAIATKLQHLQYYVVQSLDQGWVTTTLRSRTQPQQEKKVIYAFATVQDAANSQGTADPQLLALPVPVTQILFQLFALKQIDSALFLDTPGDLSTGIEIGRIALYQLIQTQLQQLNTASRSDIPPNLA